MDSKTAGDVMTRDVKTIPAEATLQEVATLLLTHGISGAPVVDEAGDMVGIISESDLLSEARRKAALPHTAAFGVFLVPTETLQRIYHDGATLRAEAVMQKHVVTVEEDTPLSEIGDLLVRRGINRVPVLRDGSLVGILTREDVLRGIFDVSAIK